MNKNSIAIKKKRKNRGKEGLANKFRLLFSVRTIIAFLVSLGVFVVYCLFANLIDFRIFSWIFIILYSLFLIPLIPQYLKDSFFVKKFSSVGFTPFWGLFKGIKWINVRHSGGNRGYNPHRMDLNLPWIFRDIANYETFSLTSWFKKGKSHTFAYRPSIISPFLKPGKKKFQYELRVFEFHDKIHPSMVFSILIVTIADISFFFFAIPNSVKMEELEAAGVKLPQTYSTKIPFLNYPPDLSTLSSSLKKVSYGVNPFLSSFIDTGFHLIKSHITMNEDLFLNPKEIDNPFIKSEWFRIQKCHIIHYNIFGELSFFHGIIDNIFCFDTILFSLPFESLNEPRQWNAISNVMGFLNYIKEHQIQSSNKLIRLKDYFNALNTLVGNYVEICKSLIQTVELDINHDGSAMLGLFPEMIMQMGVLNNILDENLLHIKDLILKPPKIDQKQSKLIILIVCANYSREKILRTSNEAQRIKDAIYASKYRDNIDLEVETAVTRNALSYYLSINHPTILHFVGHGEEEKGPLFEDDNDFLIKDKEKDTLDILRSYSKNIKLIFFNICNSKSIAEKASAFTNIVIGTTQDIDDGPAISAAAEFYQSLGNGDTIEVCYQSAMRIYRKSMNLDEVNHYLIYPPEPNDKLRMTYLDLIHN